MNVKEGWGLLFECQRLSGTPRDTQASCKAVWGPTGALRTRSFGAGPALPRPARPCPVGPPVSGIQYAVCHQPMGWGTESGSHSLFPVFKRGTSKRLLAGAWSRAELKTAM